MIIPYKTLDLIDAIENRGLLATSIEGRVGCVVPKGSDMEGLPKAACCVEYNTRDDSYKVWWPAHPWTGVVQDYVDMTRDPSGA